MIGSDEPLPASHKTLDTSNPPTPSYRRYRRELGVLLLVARPDQWPSLCFHAEAFALMSLFWFQMAIQLRPLDTQVFIA
jgi:hypothetical protein